MLSHIVGIVSGGSSGLGAATARCLVRNGGRVVVADLASQKETFVNSVLKGSYGDIIDESNIIFSETDVQDSDQISNALDLAESTFGEPVNAAISCAGICPAKKTLSRNKREGSSGEAPLMVHSLDLFSKTMDVNVLGTFNLARLSSQRMASREPEGTDGLRGCIINTASIAAFEGQIGQVAYSASKGAVVGMTLPMARDLAPYGIRVMTIAPGLFQTALLDGLPPVVRDELGAAVPLPSRLGNPDEFGQLVTSILTNPMLNGEVIRLDGAIRMPPS